MGSVMCDAVKMSKLLQNCQVVIGSILKTFGHREEWGGRKGGYFCVADGLTGTPLLVAIVGEVPLEKAEKYMEFAQEKARRLAFQIGHVSSWESRDPDHNQWGGAIRIEDLIFSFSGLPELADEAAMLGVGLMYGRRENTSSEDLFAEIATRSDNPYWDVRMKV
jgi:hypothetical protein